MDVSLRKIDLSNWDECINLTVGPAQLGFVGPNIRSLAEHSVRSNSIALGIYEGETIVGFAMLVIDPVANDYDLHRFMVDFDHQGKGIGERALNLIIDYVRALPDRTDRLLVMVMVGNDAAERLYKKVGFKDSGRLVHDERWRFSEKVYAYAFE